MSDLIAAVATGDWPSAIGIIRLSGQGAIDLIDTVFRPFSGNHMSFYPDRTLVYGKLCGKDTEAVDYCLCVVNRAPNSYTGEDCAELQCHGSPMVLRLGMELLFKAGVRQALPGEFTKRAFLNGKIDLTGAEAVADLIEAETERAVKNAAGQLGGAVLRKTDAVYDALTEIAAHYHAVVDYPDEDIEPFEMSGYVKTLDNALAQLKNLEESFERGKIIKNGVSAVIVGRPNVGKSSMLNALVGFDRAIVTEIPGTTRDTLEEKCVLGGVLLRLIDTAGIRNTNDPVESAGVVRTKHAVRDAELALAVFDGSQPLCAEDYEAISEAKKAKRSIAVINKSDLPSQLQEEVLKGLFAMSCRVSSIENTGFNILEEQVEMLFPIPPSPQGELITNARQAQAVSQAGDCVESALQAIKSGVFPDAVLTEIEAAITSLGEISGRQIREDIISRIFSRFCVGK